jgi:hypothetical protein
MTSHPILFDPVSYIAGALSKTPIPTGDVFFEPAGTNLLSSLLAAAHIGGHDLATVTGWLEDDTTSVPVEILRGHDGRGIWYQTAKELYALTGRSREGVFARALSVLRGLESHLIDDSPVD